VIGGYTGDHSKHGLWLLTGSDFSLECLLEYPEIAFRLVFHLRKSAFGGQFFLILA